MTESPSQLFRSIFYQQENFFANQIYSRYCHCHRLFKWITRNSFMPLFCINCILTGKQNDYIARHSIPNCRRWSKEKNCRKRGKKKIFCISWPFPLHLHNEMNEEKKSVQKLHFNSNFCFVFNRLRISPWQCLKMPTHLTVVLSHMKL